MSDYLCSAPSAFHRQFWHAGQGAATLWQRNLTKSYLTAKGVAKLTAKGVAKGLDF